MDPTELTALAKLLGGTLIERRDVYALQKPDGSYKPAIEPGTRAADKKYVRLALTNIIDHLKGDMTIGHYLVSAENTCRCFCFDIDLRKGMVTHLHNFQESEINAREVWAGEMSETKDQLAKQLLALAHMLARRTKEYIDGGKVLVAASGSKGVHVYGTLPPGTPAAEARELAVIILQSFPGLFVAHRGTNFFRTVVKPGDNHPWTAYPALEVEIYPKQDGVREGDGIGNLLRLALGKNRKSGKPGFFIDMSLGDKKLGKDDPMTALTYGSVRDE